jgi:hypothetical protein
LLELTASIYSPEDGFCFVKSLISFHASNRYLRHNDAKREHIFYPLLKYVEDGNYEGKVIPVHRQHSTDTLKTHSCIFWEIDKGGRQWQQIETQPQPFVTTTT